MEATVEEVAVITTEIPADHKCMKLFVMNVVEIAKFHSNQLATNLFIVAIVSETKAPEAEMTAEEEIATLAETAEMGKRETKGAGETVMTVDAEETTEETVTMAETEETTEMTIKNEKCMKQFATHAVKNAWFHSNLAETKQYFVINALDLAEE